MNNHKISQHFPPAKWWILSSSWTDLVGVCSMLFYAGYNLVIIKFNKKHFFWVQESLLWDSKSSWRLADVLLIKQQIKEKTTAGVSTSNKNCTLKAVIESDPYIYCQISSSVLIKLGRKLPHNKNAKNVQSIFYLNINTILMSGFHGFLPIWIVVESW